MLLSFQKRNKKEKTKIKGDKYEYMSVVHWTTIFCGFRFFWGGGELEGLFFEELLREEMNRVYFPAINYLI